MIKIFKELRLRPLAQHVQQYIKYNEACVATCNNDSTSKFDMFLHHFNRNYYLCNACISIIPSMPERNKVVCTHFVGKSLSKEL